MNTNYVYRPSSTTGPCYSAYVTYSTPREASICILVFYKNLPIKAIDKFELHGRQIRASFGTTKYCSYFLKGQECQNKDCLYLHQTVPESETLPKEKVCNNRALFNDQQKIAYQLSRIDDVPLDKFLSEMRPFATKGIRVFPVPETIYKKIYYFEKPKGGLTPSGSPAQKIQTLQKSLSPQIHPNKDPILDGVYRESTGSNENYELTPKQIIDDPPFEIPHMRLCSVDDTLNQSQLNKKFVRASESRFAFAKTTPPDYSTSEETDNGIEEILYYTARQELLAVNEKQLLNYTKAQNAKPFSSNSIFQPINQQKSESSPGFPQKWLNELIEVETNANSKQNSPESSPYKIKAAFDGNELGSPLFHILTASEETEDHNKTPSPDIKEKTVFYGESQAKSSGKKKVKYTKKNK